jgi:hypothetical protein
MLTSESADKLRLLLHASKALKEAMDKSLSSTEGQLGWRYVGYKQYAATYNGLVEQIKAIVTISIPIRTWDISKIKDAFSTAGVAQQQYFHAIYTNLNLVIAFLEHTIGLKGDEIQGLRDFFQANLRSAVFKEPHREAEIQNVVEQLLIGKGMARGVDYGRETGRVPTSIKEVVPDFIISRLSLAIEVKLSKDKAKSKNIVDEINADIQAYRKKYSAILFIIYDLGSIQNESAYKVGLDQPEILVNVIVIKH